MHDPMRDFVATIGKAYVLLHELIELALAFLVRPFHEPFFGRGADYCVSFGDRAPGAIFS